MADDVILDKAASIERRLLRIIEEYGGDPQNLLADKTKQDAIVLHLQRACETSIDLAMYVISRRRLGLPQESRDAFALLETAEILPPELTIRMQHMVGFRNVAIHEYGPMRPRSERVMRLSAVVRTSSRKASAAIGESLAM